MNRKTSMLWMLLVGCCLGVLAGCGKPGDGAKKSGTSTTPAPAPAPTKDISGS